MDFSQVKAIRIPEGDVAAIKIGDNYSWMDDKYGLFDANGNLIVNYMYSGIKADVKGVSTDSWTATYQINNNYPTTKKIVLPPTLKIIESGIFPNCTIDEVVIPSTITSIAYFKASTIKKIVIPDSVTYITPWIFQECYQLTSVYIGSGLTYIPAGAFYNCDRLNNLTIPAQVTEIGERAFCKWGSTKATYTFLSASPPILGATAFVTNSLKKIIVPRGSLSAYRAATNWSSYASYMEEASQ